MYRLHPIHIFIVHCVQHFNKTVANNHNLDLNVPNKAHQLHRHYMLHSSQYAREIFQLINAIFLMQQTLTAKIFSITNMVAMTGNDQKRCTYKQHSYACMEENLLISLLNLSAVFLLPYRFSVANSANILKRHQTKPQNWYFIIK